MHTEIHKLFDAHRRWIESRVMLDQLGDLFKIHESQPHFEFDEFAGLTLKDWLYLVDEDWSVGKIVWMKKKI